MKLLICCVPYDSGKSGISVYINNVVRELADAGHDLTLLVEEDAAGFFPGHRLQVLPKCCNHPVASMAYCLWILPFRVRSAAYDRVILCAANRRAMFFCRPELVAVVHDLSQYHIPVKYDPARMFYIRHILPRYLNKTADTVVAISQSTAADLVKYWHTPAGKITVAYNGIDRSGLRYDINDAAQKTVLYVSRIEVPGKNHETLLRAWELLPPEIAGKYKLVIAGSDWPGAERVHELAAQSRYASQIEFTGFISKDALHELYAHASLYVFPSLYEGFGLSLLEAMYSGLVCVCSNNSSLGEIAADAALTFDPQNPQEIADAITRALTDETLRGELRRRGLARQAQFDWSRHAATLAAPHEGYAELLGVRFSTGTMTQAMNDIREMTRDGRKHFCAFINADCINQAFKNPAYARLLPRADRVWPDGVGVAIAANYLNTPVHDNVNGTDMLPLLCDGGYRLFLFGGAPGVAEKAGMKLKEKHPNAEIVGVEHGFFKPEDVREVIARINAAAPDILLVAMGVPRQEAWICEHLDELNCRIAIGVGGLLDFASGRIPRAPLWMRKLKIEWTYRLYNEPRRLFRRYIIGNPLFLWRVFRHGTGRPQ